MYTFLLRTVIFKCDFECADRQLPPSTHPFPPLKLHKNHAMENQAPIYKSYVQNIILTLLAGLNFAFCILFPLHCCLPLTLITR